MSLPSAAAAFWRTARLPSDRTLHEGRLELRHERLQRETAFFDHHRERA